MRPHLLTTLICSMFSASYCFANSNAPVTSVVLYPGSATVVRTAQVAPGATEVVLTGLPANFNSQTLRVQASAGIRVGEVVSQDAAGSRALNPAEAELAARIEALKDQEEMLKAEAKAAAIVAAYIERFDSGAAGDKAGAALDPKALAGVIAALGRGASDALAKIQRLAVQQRDIGRKIDVLQRDLGRLQSGAKDTRALTVRLAGGKGGAVTVSYQLDNAGWKPSYRAELDSTVSTVNLARLATIAQNTGEDWSNVKLTLSTSQPRQSPVGREAQPWLLSWRPDDAPVVQYSPAAAPPPGAERMAVTGRLRSLAHDKIGDSLVATIDSSFATEFEVPGRVSLASDGREVTVALSTQTLAVKQHLRVTPRLEKFAIVMADAPRPDGVWPAGNMQLFRDGSYVGSTRWDVQNAHRAQFAFGRDELLKVAVDSVDGMSGSKGLFNGRATRHSADVFTLVNRHKTPMDVIVVESSPVSTAKEIKVQAKFEPKPAVEAWEQRRGVVAWKKTLAPNETAKFNVEYRIDYPKEGVMLGLR